MIHLIHYWRKQEYYEGYEMVGGELWNHVIGLI